MADMVPGNEREIYNKKGNVLIIYGFQGDAGFITSSINAFSRIRKGCLSPPSSRGDRDRSTISTGDPLQLPLDDDSFSISSLTLRSDILSLMSICDFVFVQLAEQNREYWLS